VSLVVAAYNEASCIQQKLENSLALEYPADRFEVVIGSDGSTDGTDAIVRACADRRVRLSPAPRAGKTTVLNRCIPSAQGDVIVLSVWIEKTVAERLPEVHAQDLAEAWRGLLYRARLSRHHRISREELSVREHMSTILRALQERRVMEFSELFDPGRGVPVLVVTFLALLELARELLIEITQAECFAPIYVKLAHAKPS
jgi:chromatin segregation and condensation protein Rec8/ScpA/Scc1 (kleisin family)